MKKRFIILILICLALILIFIHFSNNVKISSSTYENRRFFITCDTTRKNIDEYENKNLKTSGTLRFPYVINFKDKEIVFECAVAGRGASKENKAYYVILYNDGTLKYIKGDILARLSPTQEPYDKMVKYYEDKDIHYISLVVFSDYKKGKLKLSQEEADIFMEKLKTAEQYYPYDSYFHEETSTFFEGYYFNGNYYGIGNHVGDDKIIYKTYNEVYSYIEALIGIEAE